MRDKVISSPLISFFIFYQQIGITILLIESLKIKLLNSIKIYDNKNAIKQIMHLVNKYLFN